MLTDSPRSIESASEQARSLDDANLLRALAPATFKYRAFLSYAHADAKWSSWLHHSLERFRLDKDLVGRETKTGRVPRTLAPIFRDRDDFSGGEKLTDATVMALDQSSSLIVLCSTVSADSPAVNEEVRLFRFRHPDRPVIPVIIDGTYPDNFPPALRYELATNGALTDHPITILGPDLRESGDGRAIGVAKIVAGVTGVATDEIVRRAARTQRRRTRNWIVGLSAGVAALAGLALWAEVNRRDAVAEREIAEQRRQQAERNFTAAKQAADGLVFDIARGLGDVEGVKAESVRKILERAEATFSRIAQGAAANRSLLRSRSAMLSEFAKVYGKLGDTAKQLEVVKAALAIDEDNAKAEPNNDDWQDFLAIDYSDIGDVLSSQSNSKEALKYYEAELTIRSRLVDRKPDDVERQARLSYALTDVAVQQESSGERSAALESYQKSAVITQRLVELEPRNLQRLGELATDRTNIGDILKARGDDQEALENYQAAREIRQKLVNADPTDVSAQFVCLLYEYRSDPRE
jgi:tetratricopeptide (TPR) repeat protein